MIEYEGFGEVANFCHEKIRAKNILILAYDGEDSQIYRYMRGKTGDVTKMVSTFLIQEPRMLKAFYYEIRDTWPGKEELTEDKSD